MATARSGHASVTMSTCPRKAVGMARCDSVGDICFVAQSRGCLATPNLSRISPCERPRVTVRLTFIRTSANFPMPGTCVIGLQWGDEAKGKIVDILTRQHDFVVRYQGGANAGHTVVVGDQVYKLSLLPSGILTPGVTCVIATGVVMNPARVIEELDELASRGAGHADNLRISDRAHVIFPWHFAEDRALDKNTSDGENSGMTGRGIGPCYRDKVGRSHAIRLGDLYRPTFRGQVEHIVVAKNRVLEVLYPQGEFKALVAAEIIREYTSHAERL